MNNTFLILGLFLACESCGDKEADTADTAVESEQDTAQEEEDTSESSDTSEAEEEDSAESEDSGEESEDTAE